MIKMAQLIFIALSQASLSSFLYKAWPPYIKGSTKREKV
jgi:hypothetical protein